MLRLLQRGLSPGLLYTAGQRGGAGESAPAPEAQKEQQQAAAINKNNQPTTDNQPLSPRQKDTRGLGRAEAKGIAADALKARNKLKANIEQVDHACAANVISV